MKAIKWPFRPLHITNDGETSKDPNLRKLTGEGIISNAHLQGLQTQVCAVLQNPTTIVEFSPHGEPVRTDSRLLYFSMHPPCRLFRDLTCDKWCLRCDNKQALLFSGLGGNHKVVLQELNERVSSSCTIREYSQSEHLDFSLEQLRGRAFFEYDCPLLGYRELLFPIFFERQVLATFFVGQLCLDWKLASIIRRQKRLFGSGSQYFAEFLRENRNTSVDAIAEQISGAHEEWISDRDHILDEAKYKGFIERTCSQLRWLEKALAEQMKLQRGVYVTHRMDRRIRGFRDGLVMGVVDADQKQTLLWRNVESRLAHILSDFAIRYFVVFTGSSLTGEEAPFLKVVAMSKDQDLPAELLRVIKAGNLKFNIGKVPEEVRDRWITSIQDKRIIEAIEGWAGFDKKLNLVRIFPVPLFPQASMVVLIGYFDWHPLTAIEHKPGEHLSAALQSFYTVVLSALSSVLAARSEERLRRTLRVLHHEVNNSIQVLYQRMPLVLRQIPKETLAVEAVQMGFKNIEEGLRLLEQYTVWPRFLAGKYSVDLTRVPVLSIMHRWRDFFASDMRAKYLMMHVPPADAHDPEHPMPLADAMLMELALSNLIKNAVRYAYEGTVISLDSRKISYGNGLPMHLIQVSNYGFAIEDSEREAIFRLFYRTRKAEKLTGKDESQGTGLFVVKTCIDAHGWPFELPESTFVSNLCVPILYWLANHQAWYMIADKVLRDEARRQYEHIQDRIEEMCSPRFIGRNFNFMIERSLLKETHMNVFKILIPFCEGK
jgi:signal transduction histidine kinase